MEALDHEKGEEQKIIEERAELDHEVGEEPKEKDGSVCPWKKEEQEIMEERT